MTIRRLLDRTATHAAAYIDTVNARPIGTTASIEDLLNFQGPRTCYTIVNSPGLNR